MTRLLDSGVYQLAPSIESIHEVIDLTAPGPGGDLSLRAYRPSATKPLPVVVFFHGGGFIGGNLDTHDDLCRVLANTSGCVVVAVDYRLAPAHRFPAAADDAFAALAWISANASSVGGDPGRLAVSGDSAGGNLAAVTALMARDRGYPRLRLQLLIYPMITPLASGPSTVDNATGYLVTTEALRQCWAEYLTSEADAIHPYASPNSAKRFDGLPPAFIVTAEHDPLRDEGEAYGKQLSQAGVPVTVDRSAGMIHGFVSYWSVLDVGNRTVGRMGDALRLALEP